MDARTNEPLARTSIARTDPAAIARYANGATDSIVGTVAPSEARAKTQVRIGGREWSCLFVCV